MDFKDISSFMPEIKAQRVTPLWALLFKISLVYITCVHVLYSIDFLIWVCAKYT